MKHSKNNTTGIALTGCSMSSRKYLAISSAFDELKDIFCMTGKTLTRANREHAYRISTVTYSVTMILRDNGRPRNRGRIQYIPKSHFR